MRTGRFYQWLIQQSSCAGELGELISHVQDDTEFPRWVASLSSAREYLESCSAEESALAALDRAWSEFEKTDWGI